MLSVRGDVIRVLVWVFCEILVDCMFVVYIKVYVFLWAYLKNSFPDISKYRFFFLLFVNFSVVFYYVGRSVVCVPS